MIQPDAEPEDGVERLARREFEGIWIAVQGIEPGTQPAREARAAARPGDSRTAIAAEEFGAVGGEAARVRHRHRKTRRVRRIRCCTDCAPVSRPLAPSSSLTTCICDLTRMSPSTHSTYPVADSRRGRPDRLRTVNCENFTGWCSATNTRSSLAMPSSTCS
jgi:hypothetical protein